MCALIIYVHCSQLQQRRGCTYSRHQLWLWWWTIPRQHLICDVNQVGLVSPGFVKFKTIPRSYFLLRHTTRRKLRRLKGSNHGRKRQRTPVYFILFNDAPRLRNKFCRSAENIAEERHGKISKPVHTFSRHLSDGNRVPKTTAKHNRKPKIFKATMTMAQRQTHYIHHMMMTARSTDDGWGRGTVRGCLYHKLDFWLYTQR